MLTSLDILNLFGRVGFFLSFIHSALTKSSLSLLVAMSGVEAIFGVAAGAAGFISLALQLGESAAKLERISNTARNAPQIISRLVFNLTTMAMALEQVEQHRQCKPDGGVVLDRCITECRRSTVDIQQLVDKMEAYMARYGRMGKLYTAFRERDVKELLINLEGAKSALELAYTMYLAEERRHRDQEHLMLLNSMKAQVLAGNSGIQQLTLRSQSSTTLQQPQTTASRTGQKKAVQTLWASNRNIDNPAMLNDSEDIEYDERSLTVKPFKRKNNKTRIRVSFCLPTWLCSRIWELANADSQCHWNMHLATYNIVPDDSPIFRYCKRGDVANVQRLIESGGASPLDVTHNGGETLIEVSLQDQC